MENIKTYLTITTLFLVALAPAEDTMQAIDIENEELRIDDCTLWFNKRLSDKSAELVIAVYQPENGLIFLVDFDLRTKTITSAWSTTVPGAVFDFSYNTHRYPDAFAIRYKGVNFLYALFFKEKQEGSMTYFEPNVITTTHAFKEAKGKFKFEIKKKKNLENKK